MNIATALAALVVWAAMAICAVANGVLRETTLNPALGPYVARPLSAAILSTVILALTWVFLRWQGPLPPTALWGLGVGWVAGTRAFEAAVGRIEGRSWAEIATNYNPTTPTLWAWVVVLILVAPVVVSRAMR